MEPFLSIITDIRASKSKYSVASIIRRLNNCERVRDDFSEIFRVSWILVVECLSLFCIYSQQLNAQTCIVIRRTPNAIFIGADSKTVTFTDLRGGIYSVGSKCKIKQEGKTFFAISGNVKFDVDVIAEESSKKGTLLREKSDIFGALVRDGLVKMLEDILTTSPNFYQEWFSGKPAIQVAFCGIESGVPGYSVRDYVVTNRINQPVRISVNRTEIPGARPASDNATSIMGAGIAIKNLHLTEAFWQDKTPVNGIKMLINIERRDNGFLVGGPIDILRLTEEGAEWIQKKSECPDIQPPLKNLTTKPKIPN